MAQIGRGEEATYRGPFSAGSVAHRLGQDPHPECGGCASPELAKWRLSRYNGASGQLKSQPEMSGDDMSNKRATTAVTEAPNREAGEGKADQEGLAEGLQ